jgi:hypothetical protein
LSRFKEGAVQPPPEFGSFAHKGLPTLQLRQANNKTLFHAPALCVCLGAFSALLLVVFFCMPHSSGACIACALLPPDNSQWSLLVFTTSAVEVDVLCE